MAGQQLEVSAAARTGGKIAVVIPCYKVTDSIERVIAEIGDEVDMIIAVDDKCPDNSGKFIEENVSDPRVKVQFHEQNKGVGGAVMTGYKYALEAGADVIVKVDGDGFGLGWYGSNPQPGLFRDVLPAWNDENLKCVAEQVECGLFFAHVRAATGTGISRSNSHPFRYGQWLFMHNGQIGGYHTIRHQLDQLIAPNYYSHRLGSTDSETFFYILLSNGLEEDAQTAFARTVAQVEQVMADAEITSALRLTAAATDGDRIYAIRYANDDQAPTLYAGLGAAKGSTEPGLMVLSEPLNSQAEDWREVPMSHFVTAQGDDIEETAFTPQDA